MAGQTSEGLFTVPSCDACEKPAVVEQAYSGRILCGKHLAKSVRKKISKELRQQLPLKKGEHTTVLVAVSGGKDSAVLLDALVDLIGKRRDVTIVAGTVDEGIEGYRPPSIECAASLCERLGVEHHVVSYPELSFIEMDEVVQRLPMVIEKDNDAPRMACSYCGVFRRQGINHLAQRLGADVIALGHNLDDMAQTVLMNMARRSSAQRNDRGFHPRNTAIASVPRTATSGPAGESARTASSAPPIRDTLTWSSSSLHGSRPPAMW